MLTISFAQRRKQTCKSKKTWWNFQAIFEAVSSFLKVFVGTASEGVLQPGDRILSVNNVPTQGLTHLEAQNLFRHSGTNAKVNVAR